MSSAAGGRADRGRGPRSRRVAAYVVLVQMGYVVLSATGAAAQAAEEKNAAERLSQRIDDLRKLGVSVLVALVTAVALLLVP